MKRTKRAAKKDAHDLLASIVGFEVVALWGGQLFTHFALNEIEARSWADQYQGVAERVRIWAGTKQI